MINILAVLSETLFLVAVLGAIQLTVLVFRNPHRPTWLRKGGLDNLAAVAISVGFSFTVGFEIAGLIAIGLPVAMAIAMTMMLVFSVAIFNWRHFRCGERLRRADAGQSPFEPLTPAAQPTGRARATMA